MVIVVNMYNVLFRFTNESLAGIITGMDISPGDKVLAIGGSGDQAFAILEFAKKVVAVDKSKDQVDFIRQKVEFLRERDYDGFLGIVLFDARDYADPMSEEAKERMQLEKVRRYFTEDPRRLERIRNNLQNLEIRCENIIDSVKEPSAYTKVYLSNSNLFLRQPKGIMQTYFSSVAANLPIGAIIYLANHDMLLGKAETDGLIPQGSNPFHKPPKIMVFQEGLDLDVSGYLPPELVIDRRLSMGAREYGEMPWIPVVYRKIEPLKK